MIRELAGLGTRVLASNFFTLRQPYKITFAITYRCNSRCKTCNIWQKQPGDELSTDEIRKIFSKISPSWVNLTGGEPFLRKDLYDIAKHIRSRRSVFLLNLTTNALCGDLVVKEARRLASLRFPKLIIVVSLDGTKEIHDNIRGTPGAWEKAIRVYKGLKAIKGVQTFFGYTISKHNLGKIPATMRELSKEISEISLEDIHFNIFHTSSLYYGNQDLADSRGETGAILNDVAYVLKHKRGFGPIQLVEKRYLKLLKKYFKTGKSALPCQALSSSCFIEPTGAVYPCSSFPKKIGELRDSRYDLRKIWKSARNTRKLVKRGKCPGCWTPCEAYQSIYARVLRP